MGPSSLTLPADKVFKMLVVTLEGRLLRGQGHPIIAERFGVAEMSGSLLRHFQACSPRNLLVIAKPSLPAAPHFCVRVVMR